MTSSDDPESIPEGEWGKPEVWGTVTKGHPWAQGGQVWLSENQNSELHQLRGSSSSVPHPTSMTPGAGQGWVQGQWHCRERNPKLRKAVEMKQYWQRGWKNKSEHKESSALFLPNYKNVELWFRLFQTLGKENVGVLLPESASLRAPSSRLPPLLTLTASSESPKTTTRKSHRTPWKQLYTWSWFITGKGLEPTKGKFI